MEKSDKRQLFIQNIGLNHDPFETPVAEQELRRVQDRFYSYFSPPILQEDKKELIKSLRMAQHAFIFGRPGIGKSTLRLTLEADCRTMLDGSLAVTYILGEDIEQPLSYEEHGAHLAQAFTIDLVLSAIEQFNPIHPPSEEKIKALESQIPIGGRHLNRLLRILLEKLQEPGFPSLDAVWGIGSDWHIIGKAPVKYVGGSKELGIFIERLVTSVAEKKNTGWDAFWQGIQTAETWGFSRFFILVDGVDSRQRTPQAMMKLITPLIENMPKMGKQEVFLKYFLPMELKAAVTRYLQTNNKELLSTSFSSIMEWNDAGLRQLLAQRFRAAMSGSGPTYMGLDGLATPNLNLDENLIRAADGSPRRLLEMISELIDIHLVYRPDTMQFNFQDWEIFRQKRKDTFA